MGSANWLPTWLVIMEHGPNGKDISHRVCVFQRKNMGEPVGAYLRLGSKLEVKGELSGSAPAVGMLCIEVSRIVVEED
ncbi:hypothetical protein PCASD_01831 [Puccinia coronata f. sp. avenae]|uniref:Uncharacterized protein n=1 Tax=Puccinia coronata f. sp. avenae TaxID=200324 RepID=A0A2N5VJD9_9BASI|nr:hypothetical protein PCASD_01831 [Puccinia coronata f. sp. avenae]